MKLAILLAILRVLGVKHAKEAERITDQIISKSEASSTAVDPLLIAAIVGHESRFHSKAISKDGHDIGLMQLRQGSSTMLSIKALQNPGTNLEIGIELLNLYVAQCGTLPKALTAYNTGKCEPKKKAVARRARAYVDAVLRDYEALREEAECIRQGTENVSCSSDAIEVQ